MRTQRDLSRRGRRSLTGSLGPLVTLSLVGMARLVVVGAAAVAGGGMGAGSGGVEGAAPFDFRGRWHNARAGYSEFCRIEVRESGDGADGPDRPDGPAWEAEFWVNGWYHPAEVLVGTFPLEAERGRRGTTLSARTDNDCDGTDLIRLSPTGHPAELSVDILSESRREGVGSWRTTALFHRVEEPVVD